jgi:hypothetical protein
MAASLIWSTKRYTSDTADLTGGTYTAEESLYLHTDTLLLTNKLADAITSLPSGGVIGTCEEVPDLDTLTRLVIRITATGDDLQASLFALLKATRL